MGNEWLVRHLLGSALTETSAANEKHFLERKLTGQDMADLLNPFGLHEQALNARGRRLELLASNIANADTPRFRARDLDFKQLLAAVQQPGQLVTTNDKHFGDAQPDAVRSALKYRVPFNASADGNTVEMSVEQALYGKAAADYRSTLNFIENRSTTIKRALRGE